MSATVSVHIVTFNSGKDIEACLEAVFGQTFPIDQIIIVDNASADDTIQQVEAIQSRESIPVPISLVANADNAGFAPAHNQAIRISRADYMLILNPDVILTPTYVEHLIRIMNKDQGIGSATGMLVFQSHPEIIDSTGLVMNRIWRAFDRGAGESADNWKLSGDVFGVSGAAAMYSRTMIEAISIKDKFFDDDFFAYKEDVDVAWRARLFGFKSYYCAEAIGYHKRGWKKGSRKQQPLFIRRYSFINRYKMLYKNLRPSAWKKQLLALLAYEVAVHAYMLLREPKVLGAWLDFRKQLPELREKRREIEEKLTGVK
ncbi:glycosyltransferase family 2 protein [Paenibacillus sp. MSJ-6]|uniref:Glycosyltransferase family 2 protein n=2 Tax=Paenibacillus brevis TaxID=2841508 RepID=A0ABS6FXI1_9BACL|nr:glycosyltransferase family 2 protein [Paenibacillus brevis]MBU5673830.1 glycosyltransferase family 2 protein [Paenibacillus brevis]